MEGKIYEHKRKGRKEGERSRRVKGAREDGGERRLKKEEINQLLEIIMRRVKEVDAKEEHRGRKGGIEVGGAHMTAWIWTWGGE